MNPPRDSPNSVHTGFSSEIGTKLRDWAVGQAGGSCYSWAALSSNDSKTQYTLWYLLEVALMQNKPNLSKSKLDCPFLDVLVDDLDVGAELVGAAEAAAADGAAVRLLLV